MALSERLRVNFTPEERRMIEELAKQDARSVSSFIRLVVLRDIRELNREDEKP